MMNYKVTAFKSGRPTASRIVEAKSAANAAMIAQDNVAGQVDHYRVVGKTVARFNAKRSRIKGDAYLFKSNVNSRWAIILMVGSYSEFIRYPSQIARDKAYEEATCTTSPSVESVEPSPEPTGIIVSSDETSGSKSGLTEKKISNGFATSATWLERLTRSSIDKNFGENKSGDTVESASTTGSKNAPSKSEDSTFWATVKRLPEPEDAPFPGVNREMLDMVGKTYIFAKSGEHYTAGGFLFREEWLDFGHVNVKILSGEMEGAVVTMNPCSDHYTYNGTCLEKKQLEVFSERLPRPAAVVAKVKRVRNWTESLGNLFVPHMQRYVGKTLEFLPVEGKPYTYGFDGWNFSSEWLEIEETAKPSDVTVKKIIDLKEAAKGWAKLPFSEDKKLRPFKKAESALQKVKYASTMSDYLEGYD